MFIELVCFDRSAEAFAAHDTAVRNAEDTDMMLATVVVKHLP